MSKLIVPILWPSDPPSKRPKRTEKRRSEKLVVSKVRGVLSPDLLRPSWKSRIMPGDPLSKGHCYAASEAAFYLLGGKRAGYKAMVGKKLGLLRLPETHWWLMSPSGKVIDPTADQFPNPFPYEKGRPIGFLTRRPSKRAQEIIRRIREGEKRGTR